MAIDMKSLLEDDNFLIGMGLLSAGAKGQSIGEAGITSIKDAAAIKKSMIGTPKDRFRLLSRQEIEANDALDNNSNYQMNLTTGKYELVKTNKTGASTTYIITAKEKGDTEFEKGMGTLDVEDVKKVRIASDNASVANGNLNLINSISEDLNTGAGANILQTISKWGQRFDIDLNWLSSYGQDKTISNSEILQVLSSSQLFAAISQTKGSISEKEMVVFESITTNLAMSKAGIQGNIKIQEAINNRQILKADMMEDWIADGTRPGEQKNVNGKKQNFRQMWTEYVNGKTMVDGKEVLINPLFTEEEIKELTDLSQVSANEGDGIEIITDPLTKEKFWVLPGGVFEPIKPKIIKAN